MMEQKSFSQLVDEAGAAIQGGARWLVNYSVGSVLRAAMEAVSALVMWLQGLILQTLARTRASTSSGADLDSWMADFGMIRLPAVAATGTVTFSRRTATAQAVVPVGALVQTADGTQQYTVVLDPTNPAYNAGQGGYVVAAGVTSVNVPVVAVVAAAVGNAAPGLINTLAQAMPGIDSVTNALQFTTGADQETDGAFRARFVLFIENLSRATPDAVGSAVLSVQLGVSYRLIENQNYSGQAQANYFFVVVDDGSGAPPAAFISAVYAAVDRVRPITSTFNVYPPVLVTANIALTITVATGYIRADVVTAVVAGVQAFVSALKMGDMLAAARITQLAFDASPGVTNVTGVTINGGTADLITSALQIVRPGTLVVN